MIADRSWSRWRPVAIVATVAAVALALVLALAVVVHGRSQADHPRSQSGDVLSTSQIPDPLPRAGEVVLPWQRLEIAVGPPQEELPDLKGEPADVAPPEGGSFVRVEVRPSGAQTPFVRTTRTPASKVALALRADGVDYPLTGPEGFLLDVAGTRSATRWVAVPGSPEELEVVLVVDSEEQSVGTDGSVTRGRAEDLPQPATGTQQATDCGTARRADTSELRVAKGAGLPGCQLSSVTRTPHVDGLGWAPRGREYLAVEVVVDDLPTLSDRDDERWTFTPDLTGRVDGQAPTAGPIRSNDLKSGDSIDSRKDATLLIFEVAKDTDPGDLSLSLTSRATPQDPFAKGSHLIKMQWTVPGGELR